MTWIDLGAVVIILWSAVKGYINGAKQACMHLCGFAAAVLITGLLHKPLAVYIQNEWQARTVFIQFFSQNVDTLLKTSTAGSPVLSLPPLVGAVTRLLSSEAATLPVLNQDMALAALAEIAVSFTSLIALLLLIAGVVSLTLRIRYQNLQKRNYQEWHRLLGSGFGITHGLMLSLVLCIVLDALSLVVFSGFISVDLYESYLFQLATYAVSFM